MSDSAIDHAHDPHRRIRRHHYQEGPGFLILATQNGRPAADPPPRRLDQVRFPMRAVRLAKQLGVEAACRELGCSRPSLYRWLAAFRSEEPTSELQSPVH